jgi:ABC-type branched-subunit amino acid transport system permease subunit
MAVSTNDRWLVPARDTRMLLVKWVLALLVPLLVFNFAWQGDALINNVILGINNPAAANTTLDQLIEAAVFVVVFYVVILILAGYLVASDSGRRGMVEVWADVLVFLVVPILLINATANLILGVAVSAIVWGIYFLLRKRIPAFTRLQPQSLLDNLQVISQEQRAAIMNRARAGGFWLGASLALVWIIFDILFYVSGQLDTELLIFGVVRTIILPIAGFLLGTLGGRVALRHVLNANGESENGSRQKRERLQATSRVREEAADVVPNDLPLRSKGARNFYLLLVIVFVLFYPAIDPFLFGYGTNGRLAGYGDAGFYVILALGLNIVVGFAGLLDLGYVAFFAIGSYAWGMIGSTQLTNVLNLPPINPQVLSVLFWPMLLIGALIAAFWGVLLGAPTLRLRGDYLAIVTLGFGEIVPVFFLNLDQYTNGTNGIVGVHSPAFFGIDWSTITPVPYYYLILALIALTIFANIRLRDSRLGRAWIAIREDEIAAASSGVNLVRTKLFAFGAGAFFSGIAGVYHSAKLGQVSPDNFSFGDSVIYLAMVVIGGLGSIPGVIVGALAVYSINLFILAQLDSMATDPTNFMYGVSHFITQYIPGFTFGNIRNLVFGVILIVIMIFRPEGLIPSARRRRELHHEVNEGPEEGALDVIPTAPGFETEVHVE